MDGPFQTILDRPIKLTQLTCYIGNNCKHIFFSHILFPICHSFLGFQPIFPTILSSRVLLHILNNILHFQFLSDHFFSSFICQVYIYYYYFTIYISFPDIYLCIYINILCTLHIMAFFNCPIFTFMKIYKYISL